MGRDGLETLLREQMNSLMQDQNFDCLAVGVLDFKSQKIICLEYNNQDPSAPPLPYKIYDLASLTKPFTLAISYFSHPEYFDENMKLLLNHQGGLVSGGRLSKDNWKDQLLAYEIKKSPTLYSDYSALRLQLELERKSKKSLKELCLPWVGEYFSFWKDLSLEDRKCCPDTGFREGKVIKGVVNDDNAYLINDFCAHAGLFASIDQCTKALMELWKLGFFAKIRDEEWKNLKSKDDRFVMGLDRVQDPHTSLAGSTCSEKTVGHLGFTGTSFWVDLEKEKGLVILSNATKNFWYARAGLNHLRKSLGTIVWI